MTYAEKLKDPRWQKKRLEVLSRDEWTCQHCGDTDKTLHVHHRSYTYGKDPWDYKDANFVCLCESCHQTEEYFKTQIQDLIHDLSLMGHPSEIIYMNLKNIFPDNG
jgi:5-methylcytosine-specific restriction endonuclease McrA